MKVFITEKARINEGLDIPIYRALLIVFNIGCLLLAKQCSKKCKEANLAGLNHYKPNPAFDVLVKGIAPVIWPCLKTASPYR